MDTEKLINELLFAANYGDAPQEERIGSPLWTTDNGLFNLAAKELIQLRSALQEIADNVDRGADGEVLATLSGTQCKNIALKALNG